MKYLAVLPALLMAIAGCSTDPDCDRADGCPRVEPDLTVSLSATDSTLVPMFRATIEAPSLGAGVTEASFVTTSGSRAVDLVLHAGEQVTARFWLVGANGGVIRQASYSFTAEPYYSYDVGFHVGLLSGPPPICLNFDNRGAVVVPGSSRTDTLYVITHRYDRLNQPLC